MGDERKPSWLKQPASSVQVILENFTRFWSKLENLRTHQDLEAFHLSCATIQEAKLHLSLS